MRCVCENLGEIQTNADSLLSRAASLRPSRPAAAFIVAVHIGRSTPGGTASAITPVLLSTTKRRGTRLSSDWPCQSASHVNGQSIIITSKCGGESRREKKPRRCRSLPSTRRTGQPPCGFQAPKRRASRRRVHVKAPFCPCAARGYGTNTRDPDRRRRRCFHAKFTTPGLTKWCRRKQGVSCTRCCSYFSDFLRCGYNRRDPPPADPSQHGARDGKQKSPQSKSNIPPHVQNPATSKRPYAHSA